MPLTREKLDGMVCHEPGCDCEAGTMYLHARCHPESPTWTKYEKGLLIVECAECREQVASIEVAGPAISV